VPPHGSYRALWWASREGTHKWMPLRESARPNTYSFPGLRRRLGGGVRRQRSGCNPRHVALSSAASHRYPVPTPPVVCLRSLIATKRPLRMNARNPPMANQPLRKTRDPRGDTAAGYPLGLDPGTR